MIEAEAKQLISLPEAATRLDISVRGLYRLMARQELAQPVTVKVGGASKLFVSDLETYLNRLKSTRSV